MATCDKAKGDIGPIVLIQICHKERPHHPGQATTGGQEGQPHTLHIVTANQNTAIGSTANQICYKQGPHHPGQATTGGQ